MEIVIVGLIRDGADTWLCDIELPTGQVLKGVYLFGKTEEEAYKWAEQNIRALIRKRGKRDEREAT